MDTALYLNNPDIMSDPDLSRITERLQDLCLFLENRAEQNRPVRPEVISNFSSWFYKALYENSPIPPAMERMFHSADSYLSREKLMRTDSKLVLYSVFSFAHYLYKSVIAERAERIEAESILNEQIRVEGDFIKLGRDKRLLQILRALADHNDIACALNQTDLKKIVGVNAKEQMSSYMSKREKYGLWYWIKDGRSKRYFITEKGLQVLRIMREKGNGLPEAYGNEPGSPSMISSAEEQNSRKIFMQYLIIVLYDELKNEGMHSVFNSLIDCDDWDLIEYGLRVILKNNDVRRRVEAYFHRRLSIDIDDTLYLTKNEAFDAFENHTKNYDLMEEQNLDHDERVYDETDNPKNRYNKRDIENLIA